MRGSYFFVPDLEVLATDINPVHLDRAGKGIYPASSLKEATKKIHSKFK
jgi:chemotaxis methyl-accepting protein methylase